MMSERIYEKFYEINLELKVDEEARVEEVFSFLNDIAVKCPNAEKIKWSVKCPNAGIEWSAEVKWKLI